MASRIWNGRGYDVVPRSQWRNDQLPHIYACAASIADLQRLCVECGWEAPSYNEVKKYWSEGAWGIHMDGVLRQRGLWIQWDRMKKPEWQSPKGVKHG